MHNPPEFHRSTLWGHPIPMLHFEHNLMTSCSLDSTLSQIPEGCGQQDKKSHCPLYRELEAVKRFFFLFSFCLPKLAEVHTLPCDITRSGQSYVSAASQQLEGSSNCNFPDDGQLAERTKAAQHLFPSLKAYG